MVRIIALDRTSKTSKRVMPAYVSSGRGLCRATGGMAHEVVARTDSKGRTYAEDIVTGRRVIFEKSVTQRQRDHEQKVHRRVNNLCHKAETIGLTAGEFSTLAYLSEDDYIESNWTLKRRILRTLTGERYDAGKLCTRS